MKAKTIALYTAGIVLPAAFCAALLSPILVVAQQPKPSYEQLEEGLKAQQILAATVSKQRDAAQNSVAELATRLQMTETKLEEVTKLCADKCQPKPAAPEVKK